MATVKKLNDFFTGQHEKILVKRSAEGPSKSISLEGEEFVVKQKNFTELDRLSIFVHLVDAECQVVPVGAYKMIPTHELIKNPDFRGLKIDQSQSLDNYLHLRAPTHQDKKILIGTSLLIE